MSKYRLFYSGKGCGGCNLPFNDQISAVTYAKDRYATSFRLESEHGDVVLLGDRQDCRYGFTYTEAVDCDKKED